jgi:hypothetical protein
MDMFILLIIIIKLPTVNLGDVHDCTSCNSTQGRVIIMNKLSYAKVKKALIPYIAFALAPIPSHTCFF